MHKLIQGRNYENILGFILIIITTLNGFLSCDTFDRGGEREQTGSEKERVCVKQRNIEIIENRERNSMNFPLCHVYTKQTQTLVIKESINFMC